MGEHEASAGALARDLRVLFGRLRRRMRDAPGFGDLPAPQASVLARLVKEGPASASGLAGAERVRPQSMHTTIAALCEKGLIERAPDPGDGRRRVITLTATGRELAAGAQAHREEWLAREIHDRYTAAERATIAEALALLDRLVQE